MPKDMDINDLNGTQLSLSTDGGIRGQVNDGNYNYEIRKGTSSIEDTLRPVVQSGSSDERCKIGPMFDGNIQIIRSYISSHTNTTPTSSLSSSYLKLEQLPSLTVRSLPSGSFTSLSELHHRLKANRITQRAIQASSPSPANRVVSKRKSVRIRSDVVAMDLSSVEATPEKKKKKKLKTSISNN
eukprot:CAMPEP_0182426570 /NCGR_PEP_ID=MMETSP1167-20130531/13070_1 /TAXON_ID=2988 /ORGANISM="Mallomonas Sp, Strain CCMP3275" /LENGTH=183 /DNA_ID=CAMNT_0024608087 /DNA_START=152 /DNA_END=703 /DNA_ORIENTATION=-